MLKVKPKTKEQTIFFLVSNISLGTYDKKFLTNLETMNVTLGKPLTTNQADLLDKIILRYSRQLRKLEIDSDELISLPWTTQPILSSPQFTEVHLFLVDDEIILRSPYKKDFVKEFRTLDISTTWVHGDKFWRMPANTFTFREVKKCVEKHYTKVNYCDALQEFLSQLDIYNDTHCWNPTLYCINGNQIIGGITETLFEAIKDIPNDWTLSSLFRLTRYGIQIDDSVIDMYLEKYDKAEVDFALEDNPRIEKDDNSIVSKLVSIKPDLVVFSVSTSARVRPNIPAAEIRSNLEKNNIKCMDSNISEVIDIGTSKFPVYITSGIPFTNLLPRKVAKVVSLVNSNPIDIK